MEAQPKCNLIIDSCCDLPFEVVDRPGVQLLEFPYIDEKGEHSDDFYRSVTPHEFTRACAQVRSRPRRRCP